VRCTSRRVQAHVAGKAVAGHHGAEGDLVARLLERRQRAGPAIGQPRPGEVVRSLASDHPRRGSKDHPTDAAGADQAGTTSQIQV